MRAGIRSTRVYRRDPRPARRVSPERHIRHPWPSPIAVSLLRVFAAPLTPHRMALSLPRDVHELTQTARGVVVAILLLPCTLVENALSSGSESGQAESTCVVSDSEQWFWKHQGRLASHGSRFGGHGGGPRRWLCQLEFRSVRRWFSDTIVCQTRIANVGKNVFLRFHLSNVPFISVLRARSHYHVLRVPTTRGDLRGI
ncbi:hypothetical protein C8F01DRAFT_1098609 [Mycena amicta]|nr:hypothetical protein C8F01DRAFT_1098609 [Mycena amicta]